MWPADALKGWHDFYLLVGTAGATLLALLFVAASLGTGFLTEERLARRPRAARLRQARWAASLHKMRHCGSGAFDVRYTLNSGAKSDVAGCPSWI